jgi:cell envelope opacity-associated protein A
MTYDTNKQPDKPVPEEKQHQDPDSKQEMQTSQQPTHSSAAEERGERIETGKTIARGGKTSGHVPGAMPSK